MHLDPGQSFTFIGVIDRGFTAVGGLLPAGAVAVGVFDSGGRRHSAKVRREAWAAMLPSVDDADLDPVVEFRDAAGGLVQRRVPGPSFDVRLGQLLASRAAGDSQGTGGTLEQAGEAVHFGRSERAKQTAGPGGVPGIEGQRFGGSRLSRVESGPEHHVRLGATKLGGRPDLPRGVRWPTAAGRALAFIAQVALDELSENEQPLASLGGLLSVFCAVDPQSGAAGAEVAETDGCRVLHFTDGELIRRSWPRSLDRLCRFEQVPVACVANGPNRSSPHAGESAPAHQLLGSPASIQSPVLEEVESIQDHQSATGWALLLQIDDDPEHGSGGATAAGCTSAFPARISLPVASIVPSHSRNRTNRVLGWPTFSATPRPVSIHDRPLPD